MSEYKYTDNKRIESMYDSYDGPPMVYDKVPKVKTDIVLTKPGVEIEQDRPQRPPTVGEKIRYIEKQLNERQLLGNGRITDREVFSGRSKCLRLETFKAKHIHIPQATPESFLPEKFSNISFELPIDLFGHHQKLHGLLEQEKKIKETEKKAILAQARANIGDFRGFDMWISLETHSTDEKNKHHKLFLLPDYKKPDQNHIDTVSAYSALFMLESELRGILRKTVLHSDLNAMKDPESEFQKRFLLDPVDALVNMGAKILTTQTIKSLYWARVAVSYKEPDGRSCFATIAYPIYIKLGSFIEISYLE